MNLRAAVIQYAPTADTSENLETIRMLVGKAADQGADLAVLPEYATFAKSKFDQSYIESAEPLDGDTVAALRKLSTDENITIIAGIHEPDGHGRMYNTLVGIQDGEVVATYRKVHLYDAFGMQESEWVTPGSIENAQLVEINGLKIGLQTCYDLRFPEVSRVLVDAGADVLVIPAAWVPGPLKEFHWTTLLRARAIENTVYVVATDQSAPIGVGHSTIIDPMGISLATIGDEVGVAQAELTADRIVNVRRVNPAVSARRFTVEPRK